MKKKRDKELFQEEEVQRPIRIDKWIELRENYLIPEILPKVPHIYRDLKTLNFTNADHYDALKRLDVIIDNLEAI